jgi:hypothetical protein
MTPPFLFFFDDVKFSDVNHLNHRERKTVWIFSVAFLLRSLPTICSCHILLEAKLTRRMRHRYNNPSRGKKAVHKTLPAANNRRRIFPNQVNSHLVDTLPSVDLAALVVHMATDSALQVVSLAVQGLSQVLEAHQAHLACHRLHLVRLQAGSLQAKASTSLLVRSRLTCPLALPA